MNSVLSSVGSLMQMFNGKVQDFISDVDNVHMVWLEEIQQEANRMFSRDFNAEPELMPKTPSQKKNSRRKRVSLGRQEETKRRFSRGKRSNLRGSSVPSLNCVVEEATPEVSTPETSTTTRPKRLTRKNKQTKLEVAQDVSQSPARGSEPQEPSNKTPVQVENDEVDDTDSTAPSLPKLQLSEAIVRIPAAERLSAELAKNPEPSPGRAAAKIAIAGKAQNSRRSSVLGSRKLRHSQAGLRRASRRSILKKKAARMGNSTCSSNVDEDDSFESLPEMDGEAPSDPAETEIAPVVEELKSSLEEADPSLGRITRSVAANSLKLALPSCLTPEKRVNIADKSAAAEKKQSSRRSSQSTKRKAPDTVEESPTKRLSPPKKSQSALRPNMRSFLHTVQRNQMLMMTPNSLGRTGVIKSFIKHATPLKIDPKLNSGIVTKERHKLEAFKKKLEQEEERMKKMEEDKKRRQDELKRKKDERLRRVIEAKVKEEQKEEEKKKKIEQKMALIDEKNDKRLAEEKNKKRLAAKRQEELELKRKLEEEAKKKKLQQEEEKRQQELAKKAEEEEQLKARKLAEARRALELKREQERERELEKEQLAAAARERLEKEKALALQRELERAAREKERKELEERRKALEEKRKQEAQQRLEAEEKAAREREAAAKQAANAQKAAANLNVTVDIERSVLTTPGKGAGLDVTVDIEKSPQSYSITPKGANKPLFKSKTTEDYGMDQNSDDSTDDESAPRKPIPSWAEGHNLQQIIMKQYYNPPDLDSFFGTIEPPKLENIFYKSKPRYFKRTSSAVWHSPPTVTK